LPAEVLKSEHHFSVFGEDCSSTVSTHITSTDPNITFPLQSDTPVLLFFLFRNKPISLIIMMNQLATSRIIAARMLLVRRNGLRSFSGVTCEPSERLRAALLEYRDAK
jgi:hypothetical protein